ncbi:hypothetical protein FKM82_025330 [Ascaphus truei]
MKYSSQSQRGNFLTNQSERCQSSEAGQANLLNQQRACARMSPRPLGIQKPPAGLGSSMSVGANGSPEPSIHPRTWVLEPRSPGQMFFTPQASSVAFMSDV